MSGKSHKRRQKQTALKTGGVRSSSIEQATLRTARVLAPAVPSDHVATPSRRIWSRNEFLFAFTLLAAVVFAYLPAWHAGFIWDDDKYVTNNPLLTAPDGLWRIWFSFDSPSQYFPLVYTTFRIEHALWGLAPLGYHCVNILLQGVNALLLWRLLARLEIRGAWLAAAIFALHPVQVESVAWVTELKNVQMGFFFFLSLLAWTGFMRQADHRAWRFYLLSLAFYALALFSKTTACTLPAALLLIAWLRGEGIGWRKLLEVFPFALLGAGMGLLTIFWERYHQGTQGKLFTMGLFERVLIASRGVWFYAGKLFWPANLAFSYPRWRLSPADPAAYSWLLALCILIGGVFFARRIIGRGPLAAVVFFVATLSPVLGFIMLYTFRYTFVADHYQYLACIGPIALVSAGVDTLRLRFRAGRPFVVIGFCGILPALLGILTWRQSGTYRDGETLWRTTVARNPASWMPRNNLGHALFLRGRTDEAIVQYREALRIDPEPETCNNLGNALLRQGRVEDAISQYRGALQLDPACADAWYNLGVVAFQQGSTDEAIARYRAALQLDPADAEAHRSLGNALFRQGGTDEAIAHYRAALRIDPAYTEADCDLGNALLQQGNVTEAMAEYQEALKTDPNSADAHYDLGNALGRQGSAQAAMAEYQEAIRINPAFAEAWNNMGVILFQHGSVEGAIAEYREALRLKPAYAEAECNLGNCLIEQGRSGEAIAAFQKALEMQPDSAIIRNNLAWILATAPQPLRQGAKAVQLATQATQSLADNPAVLRTLAVAYASEGDFPDAIQTAQKALQLAQAQTNSNLVSALSREIKLYQAGQPFHDAP